MAKARREALTLYKKVHRLERLSRDIKDFLESRVNDHSRGSLVPAEQSITNDIKESLDECRRCLEKINHELSPLVQIPRSQIRGIADRIKFVLNDNVIKSQESQIERNFQSLSISFHLLQNYACSANQRATEELIERNTQRLLVEIIAEIRQLRSDFQVSNSDPSELSSRQLRQELTQAVNDHLADCPVTEVETENEDEEEDGGESTLQPRVTPDDDDNSNLDAALRIAVKHDQDEIIKRLRQIGANVGIQDSEDLTLLHYAVLKNAEKALDALLDSEGELSLTWLDAQSKRGFTALMYTAMLANPDKSVVFAKKLISRGGRVNIKDSQGRSAICFAIDGAPSPERKDLVRLLLESGAEPEPAFQWAEEQARRFPELQERFSAIRQHESNEIEKTDYRHPIPDKDDANDALGGASVKESSDDKISHSPGDVSTVDRRGDVYR